MSFKTAGIRNRLLTGTTDKIISTLTVHAIDMCFQIISREHTVAFRAFYFLRHLTMHGSQVLLKIASIVKKLCTKVTMKLSTHC